jgi:polyhydroxybutyrate depolymerase
VSNGGFLVQRLACTQNQIAAFASVVATFPGELQSSCDRETPSSMLMINGTDDRKVPWSGERAVYGWIMSVPDSINFWRQHNGCTGKEVKQILNARVEISRYHNCRNNSEVELVALKGVGHVWPRGGFGSQQLLNGSEEIWNFFQRNALP